MNNTRLAYILSKMDMSLEEIDKEMKTIKQRLQRIERGDKICIMGGWDYHPVKLLRVVDRMRGKIEIEEPGNPSITDRVTIVSVTDVVFKEEMHTLYP